MPTPIKTADEKIADLKVFLPNAKRAIQQFEALLSRLEGEEEFRKLWESDSAKALRAVNIDPESRREMGFDGYDSGPECNNCITPLGNACHC